MMENPVGDDDTDRGFRKPSVPFMQLLALRCMMCV